MRISRSASSGWQIGIAQHMAGLRVVEVLDAVCETVFFQARNDCFAHFPCRPEVIVAARDEHDWTVNPFDWNCGCCYTFRISQSSAKEITEHHRPLQQGHRDGGAKNKLAKWKRNEWNSLTVVCPRGRQLTAFLVTSASRPYDTARRVGDNGANLRES